VTVGTRTFSTAGITAMVLALSILLTGMAEAVPRAPRSYSTAIESYGAYQGQKTCSPSAKPGVADFSKRVLTAYKGTRSLGIVRACKVGGQSEHKEGRAWDWGVSAYSATGRSQVADLTKWLFATDKYGNRHAVARRLGIQYVIWNKRIWSAYAASSGWRKYTGPNPHTDHVHFSFTWAGANKQTSFWTGKVAKPAPAPKPKPKPVVPVPKPLPIPTPILKPIPLLPKLLPEPTRPASLASGPALTDETVTIPANAPAGGTTRGALTKGQRYLLEVSGTYAYAKTRGSTADAECTTAPGSSWERTRSIRSDQAWKDHLDLYVNGVDLQADPDTDNGDDCDAATHTYRWDFVPDRTGRAVLRLWDPNGHADNSGALKVRVLRHTPRADMSWTVSAKAAAGVTSPGAVEEGAQYVATLTGTYSAGGGTVADAECSVEPGTEWTRDRQDLVNVADDFLDAMLDKEDVGAAPVLPASGERCDVTSHTYRHAFTAQETRPVNVRVFDTTYADNGGALTVRLTKVTPVTGSETVAVDTHTPTTYTTRFYPAGQALLVRVSGTYQPKAGITADGECSRTTTDSVWRSKRSELYGSVGYLGDLAVAGKSAWARASGSGACDSVTHEYTQTVTPSSAGPLALGIVDDNHADNVGGLTVTVEPK